MSIANDFIAVPDRRVVLVDPKLLRGVSPSLFPKRKVLEYKERKWVALPLNEFSHAILTRQGAVIQSIVTLYYKWPGRFTPLIHQIETTKFFTRYPRGFCFNGMGSGKTMATLWALDHLMTQGICKKVLVAAPLSTLDSVWGAALFEHFHHRKYVVLHGSREARLRKFHESKADFFVINHAGLKVMRKALDANKDLTHYVLDESAVFRNAQTDSWHVLNALAGPETQKALWLLSGSPMPKAPTDMWAQARLVNPALVPKYFSRFRDATMTKIGNGFKWVPRPGWENIVYAMLKPAIRYATDECIDLPPMTVITREVEMSKPQKKAYDDMMKSLIAETAEGKIVALNEGVKLGKLLQIAVGNVYVGEEVANLEPTKKLAELVALIEESGNKAIVFTPFKHSLRMLEKYLKQDFTVQTVSGDTSITKRTEIFHEFQTTDLNVLLAHPQCMAHGLTLTACTTIIWYAPIDNFEIYDQAIHRIRRQGQSKHQTVVHLLCTDVERAVYRRLREKDKMQGLLLDMLKRK